MSASENQAAEIAYQLELGYVQNFCVVANAAMIFYEHITTISQESELVWARKRTGATLLFFLNRWFTLGLGVSLVLQLPKWSTNTSCEVVNIILPTFQLLLSSVWAVFSALRVFAIGGREWLFATVTFLLGMVPVATNLFGDVKTIYSTIFVPGFGLTCNDYSMLPTTANINLLIVTRSCLIASDAIVLSVTWLKTYRILKEAHRANIKASVVTLLLRDGTLYFAALLILNVLHLSLSLTNVFLDVTYFVTAFSSIIVSRFLLNLRQIHLVTDDDDSNPSFVQTSSDQGTTLEFNSTIVGNMGASLRHGLPSSTFAESTLDQESGFMDCYPWEMEGGKAADPSDVHVTELATIGQHGLESDVI